MDKRIAMLLATVLVTFLLAAPFLYWSVQIHGGMEWKDLWRLNHGLFLEILLYMLAALVLDSLGKTGRWIARLLAFLVPLLLTAQFMHLYFAGSTLGEVTLDHADQFSLLVGYKSLAFALLFPLGVVLFLLWLRAGRRFRGRLLPSFLLLLALLVAVPPHLFSGRFSADRQTQDYHWPLRELVGVLNRYYLDRPVESAGKEKLDLDLARKYGFDFLTVEGAEPREAMFRAPFPYPLRESGQRKPNVIVFFIESLSARMLGAYHKREVDMTPNLDRFARGAMRVEGYVNHTTPTVPGLFGQLCSVYPPYKAEMEGIREDVAMECLPRILSRDMGYRTIYFSHSSPKYARIGTLLVKWGFDETHLWRNFLKEYVDDEPPYLGAGGLSDHQVMRGLVRYLDRNRHSLLNGRPFFIGVSTVETHTGRKPNTHDGVRSPKSVSEVDDAIYNMDDAFGVFWRYYHKSPYAENTIVIVTADHARFPSLDYMAVAGKDYRPSVYDEVALLIRDPRHELPDTLKLRSSTLDFAPSLYHLLGGNPRKVNHFMGLSIFGDRQRTAGAVSLSAYRQFGYLVNDQAGLRRRKSFDCDEKKDAFCAHDRKLLAVVRRLQQLVREGRYW